MNFDHLSPGEIVHLDGTDSIGAFRLTVVVGKQGQAHKSFHVHYAHLRATSDSLPCPVLGSGMIYATADGRTMLENDDEPHTLVEISAATADDIM